jgi:iron complex transport system ATP-binding protein
MLAAAGLTLAVPGRTLVAGLDFRLAPGDCCAVLGRNGAGKTSLLLALAGLRTPDAGTVQLGDTPIASRTRREVAQRVGILFQDETESFWGTTLEYALLGRIARAASPFGSDPAGEAAARAALAEVDLAAHADQPYRTLSGGERQRARLAQLIVQSPDAWLLDEPLAHLDLAHQAAAMRLASRLAAAGGAVMMALHEPLWAARVCSRAVLLYDSGRFEEGPVHAVLTQSNLERLYGCRLEPAAGPGHPLFLPAS